MKSVGRGWTGTVKKGGCHLRLGQFLGYGKAKDRGQACDVEDTE